MTLAACFGTLATRLGGACKLVASLSERRIVSKPQAKSKLRYVDVVKRCDETAEERSYRALYASIQDWNNAYWSSNNQLFEAEKSAYIAREFKDSLSSEEALSHDQLAPFYQEFLERNRRKHIAYNRVWYRNHMSLMVSAMKAKISRLKAPAGAASE